MKSYIRRTLYVLIAAVCLWACPDQALTVVTGSAASAGSQQETLNGQVTTGTTGASAIFAYWAVGSTVTNYTPAVSISPSSSAVNVSATISLAGLANETVDYQVIAPNSLGAVAGNVLSFSAP